MANNDVDNFLERYEAHAGLSGHKMYARRRPFSLTDYHRNAIDAYYAEVQFEREPYVEMYIPQHRFQDLVERDFYYTKMARQQDYATSVVNQMVADEVVRKNNPAVEKAWRNYQMLLELARK